eukprot:15456594-Alexandrium_andersonii.AAC.1
MDETPAAAVDGSAREGCVERGAWTGSCRTGARWAELGKQGASSGTHHSTSPPCTCAPAPSGPIIGILPAGVQLPSPHRPALSCAAFCS